MTTSFGCAREIRVLISDMSPLIASGIETALGSNSKFQTHRCAIEKIFKGELDALQGFHVVILDRTQGMRLITPISRRALPDSIRSAQLFVINQNSSERDIRLALESGISGYATLALTLEELREGVSNVARGLRYICPRTAQRLADSMTREQLTARENDVLAQLAQGLCNKTIAQELGMALGTVKAHVKALMSKLDADTRTQVVTVAIARGLVETCDVDKVTGTDVLLDVRPFGKTALRLAA